MRKVLAKFTSNILVPVLEILVNCDIMISYDRNDMSCHWFIEMTSCLFDAKV